MKRILLGVVLCFLSSMQINAQSFSEEQLDGEWKLTSQEVDFNDYIGPIKLLKFGFFFEKDHRSYDLRSGLIEYKLGELIKQEEVNNQYFSVDRTKEFSIILWLATTDCIFLWAINSLCVLKFSKLMAIHCVCKAQKV